MSHITLVRHGQANTDALTEEDYDRLSPLGRRQAEWLGAYLRDAGADGSAVRTGTMTRHLQTADGMGLRDAARDPRLNEIAFFPLAESYRASSGIDLPRTRDGYLDYRAGLYAAWQAGDLTEPPESWDSFETRIDAALRDLVGVAPVIVVTSATVIAMAVRLATGLESGAMSRLVHVMHNTSMHRFEVVGGRLLPVSFNMVPHLDPPDRHHARTRT